jgi:hypothetical protein
MAQLTDRRAALASAFAIGGTTLEFDVAEPAGAPCASAYWPDQFDLICSVWAPSLASGFPKSSLTPPANQSHFSSRPTPARGAYHDRLLRGVGCGGRGSVGRVRRSQGGFPVSVGRRADDRRFNALFKTLHGRTWPCEAMRKVAAYGKAVWSWHPLLVSSSWMCCRSPTGPRSAHGPRTTVTRGIRRRGEHEISR